MTEPANGGLPEAAAKHVSGDDGAPHARIARLILSDDDSDLSGLASRAPLIDEVGAGPEGERGDGSAVDAPNASPRSWGFDVAEINRSYALAIWGGKAVVVNEQPAGPINDRVRVMSFESMNSWFANRLTEIIGAPMGRSSQLPGRRHGTSTVIAGNTMGSNSFRTQTGRRARRIISICGGALALPHRRREVGDGLKII